jgi:unsaturated chondroitin disaccharide hydrolase
MVTTVWLKYLAAADREFRAGADRDPQMYPHYSEAGRWQLLDVAATSSWHDDVYEHGNWTAGFWFGTMWLAALGSGNAAPADLARSRIESLSHRAGDHTTHDLGFLFHPSIVFGHQCGYLDDTMIEPALQAARMTVRRFNDAGGYIQAFGPVGEPHSAGTSTIDTMMNLPLLWWAHQVTGEARFLEVARRHARTSARLLVRPDGSTIHLMRMDPVTGAFLHESTLQGAAPDSAWSRGQAWAITGLAWAFAVTGESEFLAVAERAVAFYESNVKAGELPAWDFSDPSPEPFPDASAGAIVALGYLILAAIHPLAVTRKDYQAKADALIGLLEQEALNTAEDVDGIVLLANYSVPHNRGVGGATAWGDFYLGLVLALRQGVVPLEKVIDIWSGHRREAKELHDERADAAHR